MATDIVVTPGAKAVPLAATGCHARKQIVLEDELVIQGASHMAGRKGDKRVSRVAMHIRQRMENLGCPGEHRGDLKDAEVDSAATIKQGRYSDDRHQKHQQIKQRVGEV